MLQLADQDTSPLSEGGLPKQLHLHNHRVWGIGFLMVGPPPRKAPLPCHVEHDRHVCVYGLFIYLFAFCVYTIGRP